MSTTTITVHYTQYGSVTAPATTHRHLVWWKQRATRAGRLPGVKHKRRARRMERFTRATLRWEMFV